ncbi:Transcription regulator Rrf2-like [Syntrophomonas zehnderi OL-4]|uniref:Transcription regulator Rrf2-like n=1 Tax=Syntrophomonas zehnderi OL-4 TaxID=690567 RepID=A0A0E4C929_9FIRM|nr:Rrf2 family transcriptional regulator [Syntrophomonas zehnderi]CFX80445.1 Transcription regulator Rrf2-like [Syntrophomonas zehnderi OL-4]
MQLSSRFPVAVQILIIIAWCPEDVKITSELMARSVNTNPALIRRILGYLKNAGLVNVAAGTGGTTLTRDAEKITLLDIYRAVELTNQSRLFGLHETTNSECPIGRNINEVLTPHLEQARMALEASLEEVTIEQLKKEFPPFNLAFWKNIMPSAINRL